MTRPHEKVRYTPEGKRYTAVTAAQGVEDALKVLEDRWKLVILFHLFGGKVPLSFAKTRPVRNPWFPVIVKTSDLSLLRLL